MTGTIKRNFLVSTAWVEAHLNDPDICIFDCTACLDEEFINHGREIHYNQHHIPGSAYLDIANGRGLLADPDASLPFTWPNQAQFEQAMRQLGIDNQCHIVLYAGPNPKMPASGVYWATRAWWLLHHFGVNCSLMDGGWQKWQREGRPVSNKARNYPETTFSADPDWRQGLVLKEDVFNAIDDPGKIIVDTLSQVSYRGEIDKDYGAFGPRSGHIPGALNLHFETVTDPVTGCFLDNTLLQQKMSELGIERSKHVIAYCGGGIGATAVGFAMKMAGYPDVAIYDGSMSEWVNDPDMPLVKGSSAMGAQADD